MKKRILICEDDPSIQDVLGLFLGDLGYDIKANDGHDCMSLIRSYNPDLILLDLWLSGVSGKYILQSVRKDEAIATIPIVIVSARAQSEIEEIVKTYGANDYLLKPFDVEELTEKVERYTKGGNK